MPGDQTARLIKYRSVEWVRLGMHFFQGIIDVGELTRSLSHLADAVSGAALELAEAEGTGLGIMALGKHGGRELTYGSDLDVIFVSHGTEEATGAAERALKVLTSHAATRQLVTSEVVEGLSCPATPRDYVAIRIDPAACIGCGMCEAVCETEAFWARGEKATVRKLSNYECTHDHACTRNCPTDAISLGNL